MSPLRIEISDLWRQVNQKIHDRFRQAFRGSDLLPAAFFMLRQITKEPGVTVSELARRVGMVKSHVSKTVDHLARQGYLEKRTDPADQRLIRVYATQSALEQMEQTEALARSAWAEVMSHVPEERLEEVAHGLRILLDALERSSDRPSGQGVQMIPKRDSQQRERG